MVSTQKFYFLLQHVFTKTSFCLRRWYAYPSGSIHFRRKLPYPTLVLFLFFLFKLTVWDFQFLLCRSHYFPSKPIFPKFWAGTLNEFFLHNNKQASHTVPRLRFNLSLWCKILCSFLIASACYAKNPYSSLNNSILFKNRVAKLVVLNSISLSQSLGLEFNSVPAAVRPNSTLVRSLKIQGILRIKLTLFVFRHRYMSPCLSSTKCQFWPVIIQTHVGTPSGIAYGKRWRLLLDASRASHRCS